jgi:hypothetical protein
MNLVIRILFWLLSLVGSLLMLFLILLGMAPGVKPLDFTGFLLYGPGPGFLWLLGLLLLASVLQICSLALGFRRQRHPSQLSNRLSWIGLILLLILEAVMIADFQELF